MILSLLLLPSLALSALGQGFTPAPVTINNPSTAYTATLFDNPSTSIRGDITASGAPDGIGLTIRVSFTDLPANIGPFRMIPFLDLQSEITRRTNTFPPAYHVHVSPVPASGNCNATGNHLDPFNRGEQPPCDPTDPATCQVGDLSGKHGFASGTSFFAEYTDFYVSTDPSSNAFVGDKSIVIHDARGTRLNCGNFQLVSSVQAAGVARVNVATRAEGSSTRDHTSTRVSNTHTSTQTSSTHISTRTSSTRPTTTRTTITRSVPTNSTTFITRPRTSIRS